MLQLKNSLHITSALLGLFWVHSPMVCGLDFYLSIYLFIYDSNDTHYYLGKQDVETKRTLVTIPEHSSRWAPAEDHTS